MDADFKLRERAERYRQIARHTLDPKVADQIAKIAEDYERYDSGDDSPSSLSANQW